MKCKTAKLALAGVVTFLLSTAVAATSFASERSTTTVVKGGPLALIVTKTTKSKKAKSTATRRGKSAMTSRSRYDTWSHEKGADCGHKRGRGHAKHSTHGRKHKGKHHKHSHRSKPKPRKPVLVKRTVYKPGQTPVVTYTKADRKGGRRR